MTGIPIDVIHDILPHVAAKALLRFRCVSKFFRSFIDNPDFIKLHNSLSQKSNTGHIYGLFDCVKFDDPRISILDLNRSDDNISEAIIKGPQNYDKAYILWKVVGSCNGLVALCNASFAWDLTLWNPLTGETRKVPPFYGIEGEYPITYGFGYDPNTDDHKLVILSFTEGENFYSRVANFRLRVSIYSLKTNSWKNIVEERFPILQRKSIYLDVGVLVNNALHWVIFDGNGKRKIVAFDLVGEEFNYVPVLEPLVSHFTYDIRLSVLDGCLTMTYNGDGCFCIWVMKKYGVRKSWTELLSCLRFDRRNNNLPDRYNTIPLAYSRGRDKVLLNSCCELVWYDLASEMIESYGSFPHAYVAKIVSLSFVALNER